MVFGLLCLTAFGQKSEKYTSHNKTFFDAEELFDKAQFSAAQREFRHYLTNEKNIQSPLYVKARYYEAASALELFNDNAIELLEKFLEDYPATIYKESIYFRIGKYFYQKKKYQDALDYFNQLNQRALAVEDKPEYFFKLGYANFQLGNFKEARSAFYEVKDGDSNYAGPALYYFSHISYQDKSYQVALEGFKKLQNDARFKEVVPYYIAQILYLQEKYDELVVYAPGIMDSVKTKRSSEMSLLIGDAYYKTGKFDEAVPYLEAYNTTKQTTRQEDYQLGYAYFKSGSYTKAVNMFDRVAKENDLLGQSALYHMGESYLKENKFDYARSSFESAANLDFDPNIQEDALFNYAILSYQLDYNPFDEAIEALELYLERYPKSKKRQDVYQYLVNVYTTTKNYQSAIDAIDRIEDKDMKLKHAYQLLAFNRGTELFQNANFPEAIKRFELVKKYPIDPQLNAKSVYWTADAHYKMKDFDKSIQQFRAFLNEGGNYLLKEHHTAHYNIAYCYLQKHDTLSALQSFRTYLQQADLNDTPRKVDALLRTGDGYFTMRDDDKAIQYYQDVVKLEQGNEDYALYQQAIALGYQSKSDQKISTLLNIVNNYSKSPLVVKSLYEIANTYQGLSQNDKALKYYDQIIIDYPKKTEMVQAALYNTGLIHLQEKKYAKAESLFKRVLGEFATSGEQCKSVISSLIDLYKAQNTPEKVGELPALYPCAEISEDEQEFIYFETAFGLYQDSSYAETIPAIKNYFNKYPNGPHKIDLLFFMAESYYNTEDKENALSYYEQLADEKENSLTEKALIRASFLRFQKEEYQMALEHFAKLEEITSNPVQVFNAQQGLMRCHLFLKNWIYLETYADKVLESSQITNSDKPEAKYCLGMGQKGLEKYSEALTSFDYVTKKSDALISVQSKYYRAEIYYIQKNYSKSEKEIRELAKYKPSNAYWLAKGFILMTRNLIMEEELAQAEFTLNSVISNYENHDDGLLDEANELMQELLQLKNPEKNIIPEDGGTIEVNGEEGGQNE
jgi:tetratricopeptide (TPR) repeat protein